MSCHKINPVGLGAVLLMRGDDAAPLCGIAASVLQLLWAMKLEYRALDMFAECGKGERVNYACTDTALYLDGKLFGKGNDLKASLRSGHLGKTLQRLKGKTL